MAEFDHLWNDLPLDERKRLTPYQLESQIRHLRTARKTIVKGHARTLADIDQWIGNLETELRKLSSAERQPDTGTDGGD